MKRCLIATFCYLFSFQLRANSEKSILICSRANEVRWILVSVSVEGKCKTEYSKEGFSQIVSSSSNLSTCEAVKSNIQKNIEDGSFKCIEKNLNGLLAL